MSTATLARTLSARGVPARLVQHAVELASYEVKFGGFVTAWPDGSCEASEGAWSLHLTDHAGEDAQGADLYNTFVLYEAR